MKVARFGLAIAFVLTVAGIAAASRGDPKQEIRPADQARAKAMLLRRGDLNAAYKRINVSNSDYPYCKVLDESDLVLTGQAETPLFGLDAGLFVETVNSIGQVYKTEAQNAASWRRGTSAAGSKCIEVDMRRELKPSGFTFVSFRRLAFPRVAPHVAAYRVTFSYRRSDLRLTLDLVALRNGRAQPHIYFAGGPSAYSRDEEVRLARIVARRTAAAMRR